MERVKVFSTTTFVALLALVGASGYTSDETDTFISFPSRNSAGSAAKVFKLGILVEDKNQEEELIWRSALDRINDDHGILPRSRFEAVVRHVESGSSVQAGNQACQMLKQGIVAVFGPRTHESASHVQSICDAFELPQIETRWDFHVRKENYLVNLAPHPLTLSRAYNDLVEAMGWKSYVVIYEDPEGLFKLQDLLKSSAPPLKRALVRQLSPSGNYRQLFREILRDTEIKNLIIDCKPETIYHVLKQAQQIGLLTYKYSFILTSFDIHTVDLQDFQYSEANITAFRMVDLDKPEVQQVLKKYSRGVASTAKPPMGTKSAIDALKLDTALMYDSVYLLAKALHALDSSQRMDTKKLDCEGTETWSHGYTVVNYMKMVHVQGLTGLIQFNTTGFRTDIQLDVVQVTKEGVKKTGSWDSKYITKFNWTRHEAEVVLPVRVRPEVAKSDIGNRTFIVTTYMNNPFTMLSWSEQPLRGNARYEGYVPDLLQKLSQMLGFQYIIKPVADGKYGNKVNKATGQWNGMIKEVLEGSADIAVADLTISKERQEAVDFSMPFMNLGVSILYVKPSVKPPSLFSFLSPFSKDVWVYMCFAFVGVSVIHCVLARITPFEWGTSHPCVIDPDELVNQFTVSNSFWFSIGSIMQQGSDVAPKITPYEWVIAVPKRHSDKSKGSKVYRNNITLSKSLWLALGAVFRQKVAVAPRAVSTRMVAGIWWFFTLIMVSSYTANLATFLIVQESDATIKSLEDLAKQDVVKYGSLGSGSTESFFRDSPFQVNKLIWKGIEKNKRYGVQVKNNKEGIDKVKQSRGKYAFFMESTVIEYTVERECDLAQVGGPLDFKGYGIALPKGSKYLQAFNSGILELQEMGALDELKRKWWKEERKESVCLPNSDGADVKPLKLPNVGGVFVVLVCGCILSVVLAFMELIWKSRQMAKEHGVSFCHEFMSSIRFAMSCQGVPKPVNGKVTYPPADINAAMTAVTTTTTMALPPNRIPSNPYLDLPMSADDSYGFPKPAICSVNGQVVTRDDFM